jgi:hypothetical protein
VSRGNGSTYAEPGIEIADCEDWPEWCDDHFPHLNPVTTLSIPPLGGHLV